MSISVAQALTGLMRIEADWGGFGWIGALRWIGVDWGGLERIGMDWGGLGWTEVDWGGLRRIGVDWGGLKWIRVDAGPGPFLLLRQL